MTEQLKEPQSHRGLMHEDVVIVTGAASKDGIGYATACRLGQEGARVVITDIDENRLHDRIADLTDRNIDAIGFAHDVTTEDSWEQVVAGTLDKFGQVNGLVNNAGVVHLSPTLEYSLAQWQQQVATNLTSVFLGCRRVISEFVRQKSAGAIVNLSSIAGTVGIERGAGYSASKGGVRLLTKSLALEFARQNIRVNSVHPGAIETEISAQAKRYEPERMQAFAEAIPMGHEGEPSDVAALVVFLLSDQAKYITGAEFSIDGGLTAQ